MEAAGSEDSLCVACINGAQSTILPAVPHLFLNNAFSALGIMVVRSVPAGLLPYLRPEVSRCRLSKRGFSTRSQSALPNFPHCLGERFPEHPEISEFLYTRSHRTGNTVKDITIYGLTSDEPQWYPSIPSWRRWRDIGNGGAEISSEFTITETIGPSAMLYSFPYALELDGW